MLIPLLALLTFTFHPVASLKCHSCSGADYLPTTVAQAMASLNLSTTVPTQGNCKGTSGSDVCTNGLFCFKKTAAPNVDFPLVVRQLNVEERVFNLRDELSITHCDLPQNTIYSSKMYSINNSMELSVRYSIKYNAISFNWDTYTKGCSSVREDDAGVPTNTCYDISTTDQGSYTRTLQHCYCQKDFCNSTTARLLNAVYIILLLQFMK